MAGKSPIEWTEHTWNPIVGCSIVSPGCTHCYAMKMAARIEAMNAGRRAKGKKAAAPQYDGTTKKVKGKIVWTGHIGLSESVLLQPLRRRKPTTYFVNSEGDLFHESISDEQIDRVFAVMALCPQHTFQVLTKRAARMLKYFTVFDIEQGVEFRQNQINGQVWSLLGTTRGSKIEHGGNWRARLPLKNVWLGVSTERQQEADERIPLLLQTPAAIRFISAEPLLGPINLLGIKTGEDTWDALRGNRGPVTNGAFDARFFAPAKLDWVITGGESGKGARPMHPDWARSLREQCTAAGVPFFFKQWGAHVHATQCDLKASDPWTEIWIDQDTVVARVSKKRAGRLLDGKEHNGMPVAREVAFA